MRKLLTGAIAGIAATLLVAAPAFAQRDPAYDAARLSDEYALFIDWYVPLLIGEDAARALREPYMKLFAQALKEVAERRETLVAMGVLPGRSCRFACTLFTTR